jgi:glycosyltransferase involved in cell wall biosynthesis
MVGPVPPPYGGIASVMDSITHSKLADEYSFDILNKSDLFAPNISGRMERNVLRIKRWLLLFSKIVAGDYAFVHMHGSVRAFKGVTLWLCIARLAGAKILLHLHGTSWERFYTEVSAFRKLVVRLGLWLPAVTIVLYAEWVEGIKKLVPGARIRVINNLIRFSPPPSASEVERTRNGLELSEKDFIVVSVGTVGWRKGTFEILKAVPLVISQDDSVRFLLVGGEEYPGQMAQLTEQVNQGQLGKWVRLPGEIPQELVSVVLAMSDVFLLPSYIEGMPVAIIEAMRSEIAIISTSVGAIPDMIVNGVSGLLINPGSPEEIAQAVLKLKQNERLRKRLAAGARETFDKNYEVSKGIGELAEIYKTM